MKTKTPWRINASAYNQLSDNPLEMTTMAEEQGLWGDYLRKTTHAKETVDQKSRKTSTTEIPFLPPSYSASFMLCSLSDGQSDRLFTTFLGYGSPSLTQMHWSSGNFLFSEWFRKLFSNAVATESESYATDDNNMYIYFDKSGYRSSLTETMD